MDTFHIQRLDKTLAVGNIARKRMSILTWPEISTLSSSIPEVKSREKKGDLPLQNQQKKMISNRRSTRQRRQREKRNL
jgi:hypothetical protein